MPAVSLFSAPSSPHVGRIEFSEPTGARSRGYFKCTATVACDGEEWSVLLEMISAYRADMLGFFEELGAEAHGWSGMKEWESEFSEMSIRATNAGERVAVLEFSIRWPPRYDPEVRGVLHVRANELPRFAERLRSFLRMPDGGHRLRPLRP